MAIRKVHTHGQVVIPIGHVVEVRIFEGDEGVFGKKWVPQPHAPVIVDRTTGVVYGREDHFLAQGSRVAGEVRPELPLEVRADLREHDRFVGEVKACRIAFSGAGGAQTVQTSLLVEVAT